MKPKKSNPLNFDARKFWARNFSLWRVTVFAGVIALVGGMSQLYFSRAAIGHHANCTLIQPSKTAVAPQENFTAVVKMLNDGTSVYSSKYGVFLGDPYSRWNFKGYGVSGDIKPGQTATFNLTLQAPSTPGVYKFGAQMAIVYQSFFPNACTPKNITVVAPAPQPQPTPAPSPQPTPKPKPPKSKPATGLSPGNTTPPDTTPPSMPDGFKAIMDTTSQIVKLSWQAANDSVGVAGYQLERSTDQQNWEIISNSITTTSFDDQTIQFGTHYFYRLRALDAAGNGSGYTTTDIATDGFQANVKLDSDTRLTSEDKVATVLIPAGAVSSDAFCALTTSNDTLPPSFSGYKFLSGPYNLSCRDSSGAAITSFAKPLVLTAQVNRSALKGVSKVEYFGQKDDNSWQNLKITTHDKKKLTDVVALDSYRTFVVMGKQKKGSILLTIFKFLLITGVLLMTVRFLVRWLLRRRVEEQSEDYRHKSQGF